MFMRIFIPSLFALHFAILKHRDSFLSSSGETTANMKKENQLLYPLPASDQTNISSLIESFQPGYDYKSGGNCSWGTWSSCKAGIKKREKKCRHSAHWHNVSCSGDNYDKWEENVIPQKDKRKHAKGKVIMMKKLMKMIKQLEKDIEYDKRDTEVEVEELSPLEQKKKLRSQGNGTIFRLKFRLKKGTKVFTLKNGKSNIYKGNSRFGNLLETDNIKKSKHNIFIPNTILNPEKINNSFTLILTYVKPKNPFSKLKPEIKTLFDNHEFVLWKIPVEYQHKRVSFHLQISVNGNLSWTEPRVLNSNDVENGLVQFDVTEYAKNKNQSAIGRLLLKTKNDIFESDAFKLKKVPEKGTLIADDKVEEDMETFRDGEEDRASKEYTEATTNNGKDIVITSNNEEVTEISLLNLIKEKEKTIETPTNT